MLLYSEVIIFDLTVHYQVIFHYITHRRLLYDEIHTNFLGYNTNSIRAVYIYQHRGNKRKGRNWDKSKYGDIICD